LSPKDLATENQEIRQAGALTILLLVKERRRDNYIVIGLPGIPAPKLSFGLFQSIRRNSTSPTRKCTLPN